MMINALKHITETPTTLITFSVDMDGLRKVPENIPNYKILYESLGKPLSSIPDPFQKYKSFSDHNNTMLKNFLNKFEFNYEFKSSTENYKKGVFNESLKRVMEKYDLIMEIIPTLRQEEENLLSFFTDLPETEKFWRSQ